MINTLSPTRKSFFIRYYPFLLAFMGMPFIEFLFFRVLLKQMGTKIGYRGMTDYDIILPSLFAGGVLLAALLRTEAPVIQFRKKYLPIHLTLFILLLATCLTFSTLNSAGGLFFMTLWFTLAFTTFLSSSFLFLEPKFFIYHPERKLIFPALLVACSKLISLHVFPFLWAPAAKLTSHLVFNTLQPQYQNLNFNTYQAGSGTYYHISNGLYTIAVGQGCSGVDGVSLIFFSLCLLMTYDAKRFTGSQWGMLFILGGLFLYLVNVIRISIFYIISAWAIARFGRSGAQVPVLLFHNIIGMAFYSIACLLFFGALTKYSKQKISQLQESIA